jgi:hypothetical protein
MQYKTTTKIVIDKRKLDVLVRLGCPKEPIFELITTGTYKKTGDSLIDETLECLVDIKDFTNWGGKRENSGRKKNNHLENQVENHLGNQDIFQVVDKDKDKDKDIVNINNILNNFKNNNSFVNSKILIDRNLNLLKIDDKDIPLYVDEYGEKIVCDVQNWLLKNKMGKVVEKEYIVRQFKNFAYRQGVAQ